MAVGPWKFVFGSGAGFEVEGSGLRSQGWDSGWRCFEFRHSGFQVVGAALWVQGFKLLGTATSLGTPNELRASSRNFRHMNPA